MAFLEDLESVSEFPPIAWQSQSDGLLGRMYAHSAVLPNFFLSPMYMFPARIESGWIMKKVISRIFR